MQAFDTYQFERMTVPAAADYDFVLVNLFRAPAGAPMRPDAVNGLIAAASRRARIDPVLRPHQLRHAFGSNAADAGSGVDVVASLLGHAWVSSSQVYVKPRVLHQTGEKPQVTWPAQVPNWLRRPVAHAC